MTLLRNTRVRCAGLIALALLLAAAPPEDPRTAIARGNAAFAAGRYEDALHEFESVGEDADVAPEALHNRAASLYKLGRLDDARELWVRAAALRDPAFEAAARYNLGTCDYTDAIQAAQGGDLNAALEKLGLACGQFRDAIRLDPSLSDARANLELALRAEQAIRQQAQPQSQPSDQGQQQPGPSSQPDPAQSQPSSQPQDEGDQQQDADQGQKQQGDEGQEESGSSNDGGGQSQQGDPSKDQPSEQQDSQPHDESENQPSEPSPASQPQTQEQNRAADSQPADFQLSPEQAERLMQMIRDLESKRREYLRQRDARRYRPVERDW